MIKVSIIIPHYNGRDILRECFDSLLISTFKDKEVILVDNGSSDDSLDMAEKHPLNIRIIRNSENLGYAGGCNTGIRSAKGEYLLILNNDTIHDPEWIEPLVNWLDTHGETASVMPKILSYSRPDYFDYSGAAGGMIDKYAYPFARGRLFDHIEKDTGQYNEPIEIFWSSGTAFMVRKSALDICGTFDERFFAHMEEIDLHWRFHLQGLNSFCIPDSIIWHHSGWTLPPDSYRKKYLNHRNNLIMLLANYSVKSLVRIALLRILLDDASALYALLKRDFKRFFAIIAAHLWVFFHPCYLMKKHKAHQHLRKVPDTQIQKKMAGYAIPVQVFLHKKKTFLQL